MSNSASPFDQVALKGLDTSTLNQPDMLSQLAKGRVPLKAIQRIITLSKAGDIAGALKISNYVTRQVGGRSKGELTCGVNPMRDHRRPVIGEERVLSPFSVAGGVDAISAATGILGQANFLDSQNNRSFLLSNQTVTAPQLRLRPQVHGRLLTGISVKIRVLCQRAPGGFRLAPNAEASEWVTDLMYSHGVQIFPNSGAEPQMDTTRSEFFRGGRRLLDVLRTGFLSDNARIELIVPGSNTQVPDGTQTVPTFIMDDQTFWSGKVVVSGEFISRR